MTWRPFEPSLDETKRIERERDMNTCNLHDDCAEADRKVVASGGRYSVTGLRVRTAVHCNVDDCEDCFGC